MNIILIGLGEIALSHVQAIERVSGAKIVAGVDVRPETKLSYHGRPVPVYRSIEEACRQHPAQIVVVATSTPSHFDVCRQVYALPHPPKRIFIEKPVADTYAKVEALYQTVPSGSQLESLLHFAFSPEVVWVSQNLPAWQEKFGPVVRLDSTFDDPRDGPEKAAKRAALGNSWIDWGINALSIAEKFITIQNLTVATISPGMDYEATLHFESGGAARTGSILTRWTPDQPDFMSKLKFESEAVLTINHFEVTAKLEHQAKTIANFTSDGTPRRLSHYINMYADKLGPNRASFNPETVLQLHRLLHEQIAPASRI